MPQRSKLINSRNAWKDKAVQRADKIREYRKTCRRYRAKIAELEQAVQALQQAAEAQKNT